MGSGSVCSVLETGLERLPPTSVPGVVCRTRSPLMLTGLVSAVHVSFSRGRGCHPPAPLVRSLRPASRPPDEPSASRLDAHGRLFAGAWLDRPGFRWCPRPVEVRRHARRRRQRRPRYTRPDAEPRGLRRSWSTTATAEQLYDFDAELAHRVRSSPRRCRCSRRTSWTLHESSSGTGIEFNDGTPFNAQAVVTTLQRFDDLPARPAPATRQRRQRHRRPGRTRSSST